MNTLQQPFSAGATPIMLQLVVRIRQRINAGANQAQLWAVDTGKLSLSRGGAYQVTMFIAAGQAGLSMQVQGQDAVAPSIATRQVTITTEIRAVDERSAGLTSDDYLTAERVLHSLIYCLHEKYSGDYSLGPERWNMTLSSPLAPNIVLQQDFTLLVQVHDDPYLLNPPTGLNQEGAVVGAQEQ